MVPCALGVVTTLQTSTLCLNAVIPNCTKNMILWTCFCMHLFFNLMPICACFFLCTVWQGLTAPVCLHPAAIWLTLICCAHCSFPLTCMTPSQGSSARGAALTTSKSLREMVTKGSLKRGQLILTGFLCSPQAEIASFGGESGAQSGTSDSVCRGASLSPLALQYCFTNWGLFPWQGKVGGLQRARESFRNTCT